MTDRSLAEALAELDAALEELARLRGRVAALESERDTLRAWGSYQRR